MHSARGVGTQKVAADIAVSDSTVRCLGSWIAANLHEVEKKIPTLQWPAGDCRVDLNGLDALDSTGAWLLQRTIKDLEAGGRRLSVTGADEQTQHLLELVAPASTTIAKPPKPLPTGFLEGVGRHAKSQFNEYVDYMGFVGRLAGTALRLVPRPWRIRGKQVRNELQSSGVNALPIVGLLSFLIGIVIAYQGGIVLQDYGANVYVADIVGLSMVRELAPLITAIIVAGRTGSAYTAQIGTMIVTEEVDALRSIGIAPLEMLVLPKLIALTIALPLLTVFSDIVGTVGGLVMASVMLNLNPATYIERLEQALTLKSYLSGIGKAPVFAGIIATIGCFQGFRVFGSAESVGKKTTMSVVQSIFLIILVDGLFSVAFSHLGI